jgi:hypothetical protein
VLVKAHQKKVSPLLKVPFRLMLMPRRTLPTKGGIFLFASINKRNKG